MIGSFRSGKGSRMRVGSATNLKGKQWSVAESDQEIETINFECFTTAFGSTGVGGGRSFGQSMSGPERAACSYSGLWDAATNAFGLNGISDNNPPAIYPRDDGPRMQLVLNQVDADFYDFTATKIGGTTLKVDVNGSIDFDFSFKSQGPWLRPKGAYA
jgi:hypothetical protein